MTPKDHVGTKIYVDESFSCEGKGTLKLLVFSREAKITQETNWFTVTEPSGEDQPETPGRPGEELTWLTGTYELNKAESDNSSVESFIASLETGARSRLEPTLRTRLATPSSLAFRFNEKTVSVESPYFKPFEFKADGGMRRGILPDGSDLQFVAKVEDGTLVLNRLSDTGSGWGSNVRAVNCRLS